MSIERMESVEAHDVRGAALSQALTPYHAKYFAYELTRQAPPGAADQLSMSLFDASVDLKPLNRRAGR